MATAVVVGLPTAALLMAIGRVLYRVELPGAPPVGLGVALVVGAAAFSCLGIAITALMPTEAAAPAVANAITLALFFISGIFVSAENIPDWLLTIADLFPVKPFADALLAAFDPRTSGFGIAGADLAAVGAWGLVGALVAVRAFRWQPARA